jgi:hypothetical protein
MALAGCASSTAVQGSGGGPASAPASGAASSPASGAASGSASSAASGSASASHAAAFADLPAAQILDRARNAGAKASSFTMTFDLGANPSQPLRRFGRVSWDRSGHCTGRVTLAGKGSAQLLVSGGTTWLKPDAAFAKAQWGPAAWATVSGKYVEGPSGDPHFAAVADLCKQDDEFLWITLEDSVDLPKLGLTTVSGVRTVELRSQGKDAGTIFIAAQGTPYLVKQVSLGGPQSLEFTDYDKPVVVVAPPAGQTVAVGRLPRG